ncbi:hypothetical protein LV89_00191 [Arcicella aurantiaca]|uniref:Uncharacterized protein n=1 Tax=Arcicella aurantiaca TaxID=591202 RepID=A0A316EHV9_9BACT|nr:hypothetical protein LV89_00191 [Arcicella aurantiaca]
MLFNFFIDEFFVLKKSSAVLTTFLVTLTHKKIYEKTINNLAKYQKNKVEKYLPREK